MDGDVHISEWLQAIILPQVDDFMIFDYHEHVRHVKGQLLCAHFLKETSNPDNH